METFVKIPVLTGLRRMFYLVTPNETSYEKIEDIPPYINQSAPFFLGFVILEFVVSAIRQDGRKKLNDSLTSIAAGMFSRLPELLLKSIYVTTYLWVYERFHVYELPWDSALTWWICFLGVDLGYYWFHRLAHEVNFMWVAHQVHHSSEYYNFATALRQSAFQRYTSWLFYIPLALCVPPTVFIVHQELNILYQFWIHTEYVRSLGPLEYIINTPSHHRVHHGRNRYCIDKNYAGTLIIWDRLFGTFVAENEQVVYGLTHPINNFDQFEVQFGFTKYLMNRCYEIQGVLNKLLTLIFGPGWSPGKPRTGEIEDIPDVHAPAERYDPKIPVWLNVYVIVHFLITFLGYNSLISNKTLFCQSYMLVFALFLGYSLTTYGRLFDGKKSGVVMEVCRCLMFLIGDIVLARLNFYTDANGPPFMLYIRLVFVGSLLIWLTLYRRVFSSQVQTVEKKD